ncbi:MAG: DNA polymerase, partial [Clostridia bacterium]|nr:DNA polymerase [Clostridia bacterium]
AFGLSQTLSISVGEAKEMINAYFSTFPDVRKYLDQTVEQATLCGYATTMFGRRRYIPELNASNKRFAAFGQRTAMNHPMQGSAADIIKIAMIDVVKEMRNKNMKSKCVLQVHDELDFSVVKDELDDLSNLVKDRMQNAVKLDVPLIVDIAIGPN